MLKTTGVDLSAINLVSVIEDSIINKVGNSKVVRAKDCAKTAKSKNQNKAKGKNLVKLFLVKS